MPLTQYSIEANIFQRANPDNTPPTPSRVIGFTGTIDSTASPFTTNAVNLSIKIDDETTQTQSIDFVANPPADLAAVTVAEAVIAINAAGFTDITASVDPATGRLLIAYSGAGSPNFLQVFGDGADVFDFGQGNRFPGRNLGTKIIVHANNPKGLTESSNIVDAEEIENESGNGTIVSVRKPEKIKGGNLTYTVIDDSVDFDHMIMGGVYDSVNQTFTSPTVNQRGMPKITIQTFVQQYEKGTHLEGSTSGYAWKKFHLCSGSRGDISNEAGAVSEAVYNFAALQYTDSSGNQIGHKTIQDLTNEEYEALNIINLAG